MFWSATTMRERLPDLVSPYSGQRISSSGYELGLHCESIVTSLEDPRIKRTPEGEQLHIPPGQFGELLTEETVSVPEDALALISIKYTYKKPGLVNISGFHVDPGYDGRLRFSVYNAGPSQIVMTVGKPAFLIWYASLDKPTPPDDMYNGDHNGQDGLTDKDVMALRGRVASPRTLQEDIEKLKQHVTYLTAIGGTALAVVFLPQVSDWLYPDEDSAPVVVVAPATAHSQLSEPAGAKEVPSPSVPTQSPGKRGASDAAGAN